MKTRPSVGMRLFSLNISNAARFKDQELRPVTVSNVGRKYFVCTLDAHPNFGTKYHIDSWREVTQFSEQSKLYASEQEWADEKESEQKVKEIESAFKYGSNRRCLSIETIRAVHSLIFAEEKA